MNKRYFPLLLLLSGGLMSAFNAAGEVNLPKVKLLKKTFYYYEAKKGESLAGIAKNFGWDLAVLEKNNKDVMLPLSNGTLLYYPAEESADLKRVEGIDVSPADKSVSPDATDSRSVAKTDEGDSIVQVKDVAASVADNVQDSNEYYIVKQSESLYGIARKCNTTIDEIIRLNPRYANDRPKEGDKVLIKEVAPQYPKIEVVDAGEMAECNLPENTSEVDKVKSQPEADNSDLMQKSVSEFLTYKARRGDSWESIAEEYELSPDLLKEANPGMSKVHKGDIVKIPVLETVAVTDNADNQGEDEGISADENIEVTQEISIAIVLSDADSNKDMEFSRGALLAASRMKNMPFQTRMNIIDGSLPEDEMLESLESFGPSYVITTASKGVPDNLLSYCRRNNVPLVNSFVARDEASSDNKEVIQVQSPSNLFNDAVVQYLGKKFEGYHVIVAGSLEQGDTMGEGIISVLTSKSEIEAEEIEIAELTEQDLNPGYDYVVYATPSKKEDVKLLLEKLTVMRDRNPLNTIKVIGRPNWITFADSQKELFCMNYVELPTRFYFNAEDRESKTFIEDYKELFGHTPLKSYPVYSATAYDIITNLSPAILDSDESGLEKLEASEKSLQTSFGLIRENAEGGIVNKNVFIVEYQPYDKPEAIVISK